MQRRKSITKLSKEFNLFKEINTRQVGSCIKIYPLRNFFFSFENLYHPNPPPPTELRTLAAALVSLACLAAALGTLACLAAALRPLACLATAL